MTSLSPDPSSLASRFPAAFRWSAATSSFQVEGARTGSGRGRSIWDVQVEVPGWVKDSSTAEPGPDSFHRYAEDVALLRELGVDRYRFSLSWVRIQPDGVGPAESRGLDYYDRLIDALLEAGITPFPTLYHWDHPQALEEKGGWLNREMTERFADYTEIVAQRLSDRVHHWYTLNEPVSMSLQGYGEGSLAPAEQLLFGALPTVHHQLLAHGRAVQVLRAHGAQEVGIPNNHTLVRPRDADEPSDRAAAATYDLLHNRLFADPLLTGAYPDLGAFGLPPMPVRDDDLEVIATPLDFYGVNFYNPTTVAAPAHPGPLPFELVPTPGVPVTGFGPEWPIDPQALRILLGEFRDRYAALPPIIIAENGASFPEPDAAGRVDDEDRIAYLTGHLTAIADALADGVDVREYTVWSLVDNFEWAEGFTQRFGLVHVDHRTSRRTPKASYDWYRTLIRKARS